MGQNSSHIYKDQDTLVLKLLKIIKNLLNELWYLKFLNFSNLGHQRGSGWDSSGWYYGGAEWSDR